MSNGMKRAFLILGALGVIAAVVAIAMSFMTEGKSKKRTVIQQISVLRPPPPPPPPKPEEKLPEPEIDKQEVKMPEPDTPPDPQQADAPVSQDLGVDAQGTGNGDSFGLVGKPGGKDITTIGGGGDRAQFSFFAGSMQRHFAEQFNKNEKLKSRDYKVVIKVWLGADGRVQRFDIAGSSGNQETDAAIRLALSQMTPMPEPPPENMPQPVRLRMTSRGAV